jgi:hypothetical protein
MTKNILILGLSDFVIIGEYFFVKHYNNPPIHSNNADRGHLPVRGQVQGEQGLKASVDPGESKVQEMVETVLTLPHAHPLEALLDEPFTGTLAHATAQW